MPDESNPLSVGGKRNSNSKSRRGAASSTKGKSAKVRLVNWSFLIGSLVVLLVFSVGIWIVNSFQKHRLSESLKTLAMENLKAGQDDLALNQFNQYVALRPDDLDAKIQVDALLWKRAGSPPATLLAIRYSERLLRTAPHLDLIRQRQVEQLILIGRGKSALEHIDLLRKSNSADVNLTTLKILEGFAYQVDRKFEQAAMVLEPIALSKSEFVPIKLGEDPITRIDLIRQLVDVYWNQLFRRKSAIDLVTNATQLFPKIDELGILLSQLKLEMGKAVPEDFDRFEKSLKRKLESKQATQAEILNLVYYGTQVRRMAEQDSDRVENVINLCQSMVEIGIADRRIYLEWAAQETHRKSIDDAITVLQDGVQALPDEPLLVASLIDLHTLNGDFETARSLYQKHASSFTLGISDYFRGCFAISEGDWNTAKNLLKRCLEDDQTPRSLLGKAHLRLGECFGQTGELPQQLAYCRKAQEFAGVTQLAMVAEARTLRQMGRGTEALAMFSEVPPDLFEPSESLAIELNEILAQPVSQRQWLNFEESLDEAISKNPGDVDLILIQSRGLAERDREEEAINIVKEAVKGSPSDIRLSNELIRLYVDTDNLDAAIDTLESCRKYNGSSLLLDFADLLIAANSKNGNELLSQKLDQLENRFDEFSDFDRARVAERLAKFYWQLDAKDQALYWAKRYAFELAPSRSALLNLVRLAETENDSELAYEVSEQLKEIEDEGSPYPIYALLVAKLLDKSTSAKGFGALRSSLSELTEKHPESPQFWITLARANEKSGRVQDAIDAYQAAMDRGDQSPSAIRRLIALLGQEKDFRGLQQLSERLRREGRSSVVMNQLQAEAQIRLGSPQNALRITNRIDDVDRLWKARMLILSGKVNAAEQLLRKETESNPDREFAWLELVSLLVRTNQSQAAIEFAKQSQSQLKSAEAKAAMAELIGEQETAEAQYQDHLEQNPSLRSSLQLASFYARQQDSEKAIKKLEDILFEYKSAPPNEMAAAKRLLAKLISRRSYPGFQRALKLVDENLASLPNKGTDFLEKARILSQFRSPLFAKQVVELLERVQIYRSLDPKDLVILATAYDILERPLEANRYWELLTKVPGLSPDLWKQYVLRQLNQEELEDAASGLKKLEKLVGVDAVVLNLKARLHCLNGKPNDAVNLANEFVESSNDNERASQTRIAADTLASINEKLQDNSDITKVLIPEVERLYEIAERTDPQALVNHALFLASQGGNEVAALNLIEKASGKVNEFVRLQAAVRVIEISERPTEFSKRVEPWVFDNVQRTKSIQGLWLWEMLLIAKSEFESALNVNSQILEMHPDNMRALNNQAWLLTVLDSPQEALNFANRAVELGGPSAVLLDTRGMTYAALSQWANAIQDLNNAFSQDKSAVFQYHLAKVYHQANQKDSARFHARQLQGKSKNLIATVPANERDQIEAFLKQYRKND